MKDKDFFYYSQTSKKTKTNWFDKEHTPTHCLLCMFQLPMVFEAYNGLLKDCRLREITEAKAQRPEI